MVPVTGLSNELLALAHARGVATDYWDWRGNHVQVPEETIVAVLAAMDLELELLGISNPRGMVRADQLA